MEHKGKWSWKDIDGKVNSNEVVRKHRGAEGSVQDARI